MIYGDNNDDSMIMIMVVIERLRPRLCPLVFVDADDQRPLEHGEWQDEPKYSFLRSQLQEVAFNP